MIKFFCDHCGEEILRSTYPFELKWKGHFCNKECRAAYDKASGHFKNMSDKGKAGRSRVMPQSNRENPRRRKGPICYQL